MIEYRTFDTAQLPQVLVLYEEAGWTAYLGDVPKLERAFQNSLYLLGAFDGARLAGFLRCVGDGEHIVQVQDLLVSASCRRQGVGTALMDRARDAFSHVRAFVLTTDAADQQANAFYRALGLKQYHDMGLTGYWWPSLERNRLENT